MSAPFPPLIRSSRAKGLRAVFGYGFFGYPAYFSASLPDRLYSGLDDAQRPLSVISDEPAIDTESEPTAVEVLVGSEPPGAQGWPTATRNALARLESLWLLAEDRQRLLDAQAIDPLPHQAALVEHVLSTPGLERVLIADEVGLGKTVEAGLIIKRLQRATPTLRVLYLTEARLVPNVVDEFERIGLNPRPRLWTAEREEARLRPGDSDAMVVASIHKAVANADQFAASGPWDVLVVDEAHHLTDYSTDGGDPQVRMRLVRKLVNERLTSTGRLILLSGTPHQGHPERFRNLLRLLSPSNNERDAGGRLIYRIKDDILGWDGEPLFPLREVRPHRVVRVSEQYHRWLAAVHALLEPAPGAPRASAWRRAQALQWCASSPEAGLAYLVRLALRSGQRHQQEPALRAALAALRPYREGSREDPLDALQVRLLAGARELEDDVAIVFGGGEEMLRRVLTDGATLVESDTFGEKLRVLSELLDASPDEKFVVFAQPIETVFTLRRRLEAMYGVGTVSFIVGGQSTEQRNEQIERFVNAPGARVMVSSRSGGEGINLQVARRLVHFDVPWNPMEMEQRVGRVHRYGGVRTVFVDTLVLDGSRETRVLDRARARLAAIVRDIDRSRFELLFSRTMALIPLEELAALMAGEQFSPLEVEEEQRLDRLVQQGLELFQATEREFRSKASAVGEVARGEVCYADMEAWLQRHGRARALAGYRRRALSDESTGRVSVDRAASVLALEDGRYAFVAPEAGVGIVNPAGQPVSAKRIGLNDAAVSRRMREVVGEDAVGVGAGSVLVAKKVWESWRTEHQLDTIERSGGVLLAYLVRRLEASASPPERSVTVHGWMVTSTGGAHRMSASAFAGLVRMLREPRPKQRPGSLPLDALRRTDAELVDELRRIAPSDPSAAVFPLAAIQIEVD